MGMQCPDCNTYQPIRRTITVTGKAAHKGTDVIAFELGCGYTVGGEEYREFEAAREKVLAKLNAEQLALKKKADAEMAAAYKNMKAKIEAK